MKCAVAAFSVLVFVSTLHAQITATLERTPSGIDRISIRNGSALDLVAFVVTVRRRPMSPGVPAPPFVVFSDSLTDTSAKPLRSGEEQVVIEFGGLVRPENQPRHLDEPIMTAGLLADGATVGDPNLFAKLMWRRSNMLLAVETSLEILTDAGRINVAREKLVNQFKRMSDSLNRSYLPPEQQVGRSLYQSIAGKLLNLPEGELGTPFPPTTFVLEETAALNRQRVALLESQPSLMEADAALGAR